MTGGWGTQGPKINEKMLGTDNTFVQGKDPETARGLLDAAEATGHPAHTVRTVQQGFMVPNEVADAWLAANTPDPEV